MNEKEILEYNKRCAMFLGYKILSKPYKGAVTVQEGCYNPMFLHDRIEGESWYVYPEFHSDWNWIMEMVEAIEKLGETDKTYGTLVDITTTYVKIDKVLIDLKLIPITKKEAVVDAINQFLIWYEQNK